MSAKEQKFPQLFHGRPEWPNQDDEHLFWVGLNTQFQFSHHPVKEESCPNALEESFFCRPAQVADQLLGVLKDSWGGGSILVTGYRGTGKTSLVNHCLKVWKKERSEAAKEAAAIDDVVARLAQAAAKKLEAAAPKASVDNWWTLVPKFLQWRIETVWQLLRKHDVTVRLPVEDMESMMKEVSRLAEVVIAEAAANVVLKRRVEAVGKVFQQPGALKRKVEVKAANNQAIQAAVDPLPRLVAAKKATDYAEKVAIHAKDVATYARDLAKAIDLAILGKPQEGLYKLIGVLSQPNKHINGGEQELQEAKEALQKILPRFSLTELDLEEAIKRIKEVNAQTKEYADRLKVQAEGGLPNRNQTLQILNGLAKEAADLAFKTNVAALDAQGLVVAVKAVELATFNELQSTKKMEVLEDSGSAEAKLDNPHLDDLEEAAESVKNSTMKAVEAAVKQELSQINKSARSKKALQEKVMKAVGQTMAQAQGRIAVEVERRLHEQGLRQSQLLIVRVNMATVACAHDVLLLAFEALKAELDKQMNDASEAKKQAVKRALLRLREATGQLRSIRRTEHGAPRVGIDLTGSAAEVRGGDSRGDGGWEQTFEREALSRYQAILVTIIKDLELAGLHPVFVFDEVDKLMPVRSHLMGKMEEGKREAPNHLEGLQQIVAELKYFLSESPSHQIFIAGKDVDDSWAEDQNKGEGIFESIFASNIQVSSIFTLELEPCATLLPKRIADGYAESYAVSQSQGDETPPAKAESQSKEARQKRGLAFYEALARQLGVAKNSLVIRTALLILPYLAEYEMVQILRRGYDRVPASPDKEQFRLWLEAFFRASRGEDDGWKGFLPGMLVSGAVNDPATVSQLAPMSERTCRRIRILLEYLTYKGRGIPRKILREFYGMVRPATCVPSDDPGYWKLWRDGQQGQDKKTPVVRYVLSFPQHHLQKMNFYAAIVEHLDENFNLLRGLNDKGRVSIFHIVDYLLKFYTVGFSHRDLEHAPFMTDREELFPSRQLATLILRIMDGRLWRRKDSRGADYRMLHHVAHDLGVMFLRYSPEQMELRHTPHDFHEELRLLNRALEGTHGMSADKRLAPIHAQMRLARIHELCGRHYEARLAYYGVLRWLRQDVSHFEQAGASLELTQGQTRAVLPSYKRSVTGQSRHPHTPDFPVTFVGYTVETHQSLGRLLEEVGELRAALQHYEEACALCEAYTEWPKSIKGTSNEGGGDLEARDLIKTLFEDRPTDPDKLLREQFGKAVENLDAVLKRTPPMRPLNLAGIPQGYVQICNNAAIAYSKLWERTSANAYLLKALLHLDAVGDEYGLVDQMFFIGQVMVRRRDLHAAAHWYRAALKKATAIRKHASPIRSKPDTAEKDQTPAGWQTPPISATTEAQIFAALGDVIFATGGYVFAGLAKVSTATKAKTLSSIPEQEVWKFIKNELMADIPEASRNKIILAVDDRWEEYFFTRARRSFEADDRDVDARDVYLRQLETRFSRFEQAAGILGRLKEGEQDLKQEYTLLNAWTTFWRGARVLMHRNLTVLTSLSRDQTHEWGRIGDFRRMGTMLRLISAMLTELGLRSGDSASRELLAKASSALQLNSNNQAEIHPFYKQFVQEDAELGTDTDLNHWMGELAKNLKSGFGAEDEEYNKKPWWEEKARINVNTAANDILIIFAYIGDRSDLMTEGMKDAKGIEKANSRSPLFRINGHGESEGPNEMGTPITYLKKELKSAGLNAGEMDIQFKLLAISEKALLSSYLCYRDCIPDYSYAQTCIQLGELYSAALYKLGIWSGKSGENLLLASNVIGNAVHYMTEYAKRFLIKALDILKREQEQNRNTFHLMSEAYFNLGDILLIRLMAITGGSQALNSGLFQKNLATELKMHFDELVKRVKDGKSARDFCPEDLRRQIIAAYQQGLKSVQDEMNDYYSRYRVPAEVYYSNRNVMDPVLHFRICRAARLRHAGVRPETASFNIDEVYQTFEENRMIISDLISGYESPQSFTWKPEGGDASPSAAWAKQLEALLKFVNKVCTDRGPLEVDAEMRVNWRHGKGKGEPAPRGDFVFFANQSPP